ncbi:MAG: LysR family transcriptional regulator [Magnetococcus sp. DMHC-6]
MDIDLLRTFLEVYRTRHFGRASRVLFITQSAISTRIRQLEEMLGTRLFSRKRNDIQLTAAGKRFIKYAESILSLWEEAKKNVILEEHEQPQLFIGAHPTLWDFYLPEWVEILRRDWPILLIRCETYRSEPLIQRLRDKSLDVGFMFDPPKLSDLLVREVETVTVVMVSTQKDLLAQQVVMQEDVHYILVDWGGSFLVEHSRWFPEAPVPFIQIDRGKLAYDYLLKYGGAAYLDHHCIQKDLEANTLFLVQDAPTFKQMVYAVYLNKGDNLLTVEETMSCLLNNFIPILPVE